MVQTVKSYVDLHRGRLIELIRDLVRIPSENKAPNGSEAACQAYIAHALESFGWRVDLYSPASVPGLTGHPMYWPGRDYTNRPNIGARREGTGGGRSLVLSGHIDTVPRGTQAWTRDPFGAEMDSGRIYGRGSNDMKAGVATNLFVAQAIADLELRLKGDLIFESVVDEEFGGVNGTLAGRLAGYNAAAAVISEPSFLRICPAQRGGRIAHITLQSATGGVLTDGAFPSGVLPQLRAFLNHVPEFARLRRSQASVHELYAHHSDPVPVSITKVYTGPWGMGEPMTVPGECLIEMYWQAMPGETQEQIDAAFFTWLNSVCAAEPAVFGSRPRVEFPIRWLPGSAIDASEPLVQELGKCAAAVLGREVPVVGIEGPCDMYAFHQGFGIPAVLWGGIGGNTHAADEYVEVDSIVDAAKTLLLFVCRWCGVAESVTKENERDKV